jgi:hypothetical protein
VCWHSIPVADKTLWPGGIAPYILSLI